jgi:hypothetical protein
LDLIDYDVEDEYEEDVKKERIISMVIKSYAVFRNTWRVWL